MALTDFQPNRTDDVASPVSPAMSGREPSKPQSGPGALPAGAEFLIWLTPWPIRISLGLLLLFEIAYMGTSLLITGASAATLATHAFSIAAPLTFLFILNKAFFLQHWRGLSMALFAGVIASTLVCVILGSPIEWLFITVILLMLGAGTLVPWDYRWQSALTLTALGAMVLGCWSLPSRYADPTSHWGELLIAGGLGYFMTVIGQRYRRELRARLTAVEENNDRLFDQFREREAAVAERERALQRLRESEAKLRKVFETSLDAIAINRMDDGRFIDVNHEFTAVFGYSAAEVTGHPVDEFGIWVHPEQARALLEGLETHGFVRDLEAELQTKSGSRFPAQVSAGVAEVDGAPCVISVARDSTAPKRFETELIETREAALAGSRAKSDFVSNISHEIRTAMNAILGTADLLSETALSFEQRHYVQTMRTNGNAMLALVNDVLDLARVESGRLNLERVKFDLRNLVENALETLATLAHEKKLELVGRITPDLPTSLLGDPLRLRQILINLVGNAIKFTEQGEIVVTVEKLTAPVAAAESGDAAAQNLFRIAVADTGVGISADQRGAIFTGFAQAKASTAREYGGSGLGLAIVKRLVELMDGRIEVESEVGKGSVFSVTVPLELQSSTAEADDDAYPTLEPRMHGKRVMIADDTEANRAVAAEWLTQGGAETTCVADGIQALDEVRRARLAGRPYDLVLLDARMPGMDGIAVARSLLGDSQRRPSVCEAVVLMLTSDELTRAVGQMRESGLDSDGGYRYVVKPLKRGDVLAIAAGVFAPKRNGKSADAGPPPPLASAVVDRPLQILLAEDSLDNRLLIQAFLKQHPYSLEFAENGQTALELVMTHPYDLVLMDIQMPILDGYAAARRIREWEHAHERPRVPIIALTASALNEAVRKSLDAGCDAHITKPVRKATLIDAIRKATALPNAPERSPERVEADR
jgi:two-component system, sensor histidine kinase and response regulator